jgi:hypothetical protein
MFEANSARHSVRGSSDAASSTAVELGVRDFLIRGCQKVIGHYERLLSTARSEQERQLYQARIEREQRVMDVLRQGAYLDRLAA